MLLHVPNNHLTPVSKNIHPPDGSDIHSTMEIHVDLQDLLSSRGRGTIAVPQRLDCLHGILASDLAAPAVVINRLNDDDNELFASEPVF